MPPNGEGYLPRAKTFVSWPVERSAGATVKLGKTTRSEVQENFGDPLPSRVFYADTFDDKCAQYYVKRDKSIANGYPAGEGIAMEGQLFLFESDVVVAQAQYSSYKSNNTNFDETLIGRIVEGQTTRDEVLKLLGPANGSRLGPADSSDNPTGLEYLYVYYIEELSFGSKQRFKWLSVEFDNGVVSHIRYRAGKSTATPDLDTDANDDLPSPAAKGESEELLAKQQPTSDASLKMR